MVSYKRLRQRWFVREASSEIICKSMVRKKTTKIRRTGRLVEAKRMKRRMKKRRRRRRTGQW